MDSRRVNRRENRLKVKVATDGSMSARQFGIATIGQLQDWGYGPFGPWPGWITFSSPLNPQMVYAPPVAPSRDLLVLFEHAQTIADVVAQHRPNRPPLKAPALGVPRSSLHREFVECLDEDQKFLLFAARYGMIRPAELLLHRPMHSLPGTPLEMLMVQPLSFWRNEARLVSAFIEAMEWMQTGRRALAPERVGELTRLFRLAEDGLKFDSDLRPVPGRPIERDQESMERGFLNALASRYRRLGVMSHNFHTATVAYSPSDLLGWIYLALYEEHFTGRALWRKCRWCGGYFELTNQGKIVCDDECGNARNYYNRKQRNPA